MRYTEAECKRIGFSQVIVLGTRLIERVHRRLQRLGRRKLRSCLLSRRGKEQWNSKEEQGDPHSNPLEAKTHPQQLCELTPDPARDKPRPATRSRWKRSRHSSRAESPSFWCCRRPDRGGPS